MLASRPKCSSRCSGVDTAPPKEKVQGSNPCSDAFVFFSLPPSDTLFQTVSPGFGANLGFAERGKVWGLRLASFLSAASYSLPAAALGGPSPSMRSDICWPPSTAPTPLATVPPACLASIPNHFLLVGPTPSSCRLD